MQTVELPFDSIEAQTKTAICFDMGDAEPVWIPISCINMELFDPRENFVDVAAWFAEREGLI